MPLSWADLHLTRYKADQAFQPSHERRLCEIGRARLCTPVVQKGKPYWNDTDHGAPH
jgi:hypothetical protein